MRDPQDHPERGRWRVLWNFAGEPEAGYDRRISYHRRLVLAWLEMNYRRYMPDMIGVELVYTDRRTVTP